MEIAVTPRERLALWIERSKINQLEAARIIGIDPTQLSQILNGKRRPGLDNATAIERKTGISVHDWVPTRDDEDEDEPGAPVRRGRFSKA